MKDRDILELLIAKCDCEKCNYELSYWYDQSRVIGRFVRDAYEGSHLEGKPCMYAQIELGGNME